jgi:hypothetical protein
MQTLPPPPYQGPLILTSAEFVAELTPEKLTAIGDKLEQAAIDLVPIKARLDALTYELANDWCAPRVLKNELYHLSDSVGLGIEDFDDCRAVHYVSKYLNAILITLQDGEADLAIWQKMTPAERDERWAQHEREKVEAVERRKKRAEIRAKQNAFYSALSAMGLSPIPTGAEVRFTKESDRRLHELELEISNMGNHLHE